MTPCVEADAPALAALHAGCFTGREAWGAEAIALMLRMPGAFGLWRPGAGLLLARAIAGEAEILTLAVLPVARRQGLGLALMTGALTQAAAAGAAAMLLEVAADNTAAQHLYARLGFTEVGRRRRYYTDGRDALVLRRALSPPPCEAAKR